MAVLRELKEGIQTTPCVLCGGTGLDQMFDIADKPRCRLCKGTGFIRFEWRQDSAFEWTWVEHDPRKSAPGQGELQL